MEVTCDRCQAEYEFEETLVSEGGTTVKCTNCGHLFKVHRPPRSDAGGAVGGQAGATGGAKRWAVRSPAGDERQVGSLEELTKEIIAGELSRDDRISHTGKAWRRLGDISELEVFFRQAGNLRDREALASEGPATADGADADGGGRISDRPLPPPAPMSSSAPMSVPPPPQASRPPGGRPRRSTPPPRFENLGTGVPAGETTGVPAGETTGVPAGETTGVPVGETTGVPVGETTGVPAARPARDSVPPPPPQLSGGHGLPEPLVTSSVAPDASVAAAATSTTPPSDDEAVDFRPPRRSPPMLLLLIVSVGLVAGALWFMGTPPKAPPPATAPDASPGRFIERGERALAQHDPDHFQEAATEFTKALAFQEHDPYLLSALSRINARWSQQLLLQAQLLERLGDRTGLDALLGESRQLAERARASAETAARKNPGNNDAEVALSDALRLSGNLVAARAELDRARATQTTTDSETLRVAAWLAIAEAGGDPTAGRKLAEQAVAQEPESLPFRILLAHILLAGGDRDAAAYHLTKLNKQAPAHPIVGLLQRLADSAADSGRPDAQAKVGAQTAETDAKPDTAPDAEAIGRQVARLCRTGENLLEQGDEGDAQRQFEEALSLAPNSARAITGLAYVHLEQGHVRKAQALFRKASRAGYPEAFIGLGSSLRRLNRNADALTAYKTYLRRFPRGRSVSIASRQVQLLEEALKTKPSTPDANQGQDQ